MRRRRGRHLFFVLLLVVLSVVAMTGIVIRAAGRLVPRRDPAFGGRTPG